MQRNPPQKRFLLEWNSPLLCDLPDTSRFASRLVQAVSAWSLKTRRAPSRHCRDTRVYGHTTTAMHDIEYTPPARAPSPPSTARCLVPAELGANRFSAFRGGIADRSRKWLAHTVYKTNTTNPEHKPTRATLILTL